MKQTIKANILIQQELIIKAFSIKWKFNNVKYNGKEKKINTITKHKNICQKQIFHPTQP